MSDTETGLTARHANPQVGIIDVRTDLTGATEPALMRAYAALGDARAVVLNFSGLGYMNSTGIGLLVTLLVRAKRQGQAVLACCLDEHYRHIFELTRLDDALRVYPTEAEAIQAAGAR